MNITSGPHIIRLGTPFTQTVRPKFDAYLRGVWVFMGYDRHDAVEADVEVWDDAANIPLVLRSDHKEGDAYYDAWTYYDVGRTVDFLRVHFHAHTTMSLREAETGRGYIRAHFGVHLLETS